MCDTVTPSTSLNHFIYCFARLGKHSHVVMSTWCTIQINWDSCEGKELALIQATECIKSPQTTTVLHCNLGAISLSTALVGLPTEPASMIPPWFFQSRNIYRNTSNIRCP
jgi:hypothetical protein